MPSSSMVFQLSQTEDETAFNGCSGGGRAVLGGARAAVCGWERASQKWSRSHGASPHAEGGRFAVRNRCSAGRDLHCTLRKTEQEASKRSFSFDLDEVVPCAALIELLRFPRVLGTVHRASRAPRKGASFLAASAAEGAEGGR